ncbi:hypothetical protein GBA52_014566 [Prunus armeniaca]|nr:hypothetical protein GBA52_014566 [Prunus armeniaca]
MAICCTRSKRRLTRMSLRRTKRPFQGQPNHIGMIRNPLLMATMRRMLSEGIEEALEGQIAVMWPKP